MDTNRSTRKFSEGKAEFSIVRETLNAIKTINNNI